VDGPSCLLRFTPSSSSARGRREIFCDGERRRARLREVEVERVETLNGGTRRVRGHVLGHVQERLGSVVAGFPPQADFISALGGLYVKKGASGQIRTIVHAGDSAPGGGNFRQVFHDVMNNNGQIASIVTPSQNAPGTRKRVSVS